MRNHPGGHQWHVQSERRQEKVLHEKDPPSILEEGEKQTVKPNSGQVDFWQSYAPYKQQHRTVFPPSLVLSIAVSGLYQLPLQLGRDV